MSYVIQLADRSFIIIDGGTDTEAHKETLYNYLKERTPSGTKPEIACWFISHSDADHIGLATAFIKEYKDKIIVKGFAYNFPEALSDETANGGAQTRISAFEESRVASFVGAEVITLNTADTLSFCGVTVDVLLTHTDSPEQMTIANDASVVLRITFTDSGITFLSLADVTEQRSTLLAETYTGELKSDILQVAHHGLVGGALTLYEYIEPSVCLWSNSLTSIEEKGYGTKDYNTYLWSLTDTAHYYADSTVTLVIGDTVTVQE